MNKRVTYHPPRRFGAGTIHPRSAKETMQPVDTTTEQLLASGTMSEPMRFDEEAENRFNKCKGLLTKGKHEAAARLLEDLHKQCPRVNEIAVFRSYALGCVRQAAGDGRDAEMHFRRSLAMDPYFEPARQALAALKKPSPSIISRLFHRDN